MPALSILITCSRAVAPLTAAELEDLGFAARVIDESTLGTEGSWLDVQRLCLHLRTAQHVLVQIGEARAENLEDIVFGRMPRFCQNAICMSPPPLALGLVLE